ncbi:caspase family protein [Bradyrhizobium lablabi]|uniref:caspase family protein n=1 Tax=Bradyrhizobium lablabi TaxID=722472 RepID=UPI001BAA5985|nr:caspase family protein [Bradyrhizobium lablabi]MBR1120275.1 caspase family protein [Bradyrhizobium lablabi]
MSRLKSFLRTGLLVSLLGFIGGASFAQTSETTNAPAALRGPEQRVALVIGNSNYQNAPDLANPGNDAQSMAQLLNQAGFEVISATDLTHNDMLKVVQDFSARVASRGQNTVAMVYYAGHGVQLAGENYLVPTDAKISSPNDLVSNSVRLVDVMATLEAIPSRLRIVLLDACRNNPFKEVNDAGRGLAIVDAPNGSIVGYSTAPGAEALDGTDGHSPYTSAFLKLAREPNVPIEQLFKRVRLEVNNTTDGRQIPWESSSLTSDFTFFGDTAVAANRAPIKAPVVQMASNLPSRSARQAYDYVLSEGSPQYYEEFIAMYPHDPLCDRIRWLLRNMMMAQAWHKAVLANSPFAYKTFADNYAGSPYAQAALALQAKPKIVPLMQATHLIAPAQLAPNLKPVNFGLPKEGTIKLGDTVAPVQGGKLGIALGDKPKLGTTVGIGNGNTGINGGGKIVTLPPVTKTDAVSDKKIVTLPAPGAGSTNGNTGINGGKIATLPGTTVGKAGANTDVIKTTGPRPDIKATLPPKRIVDAPVNKPKFESRIVRREPVIMKQSGPAQGGRFQGRIGGMGSNGGSHFASSMNQGGGRRGFMR